MRGIYEDIGPTFTTVCTVYPHSVAAKLLKIHPSVREITHLAELTLRNYRAFIVGTNEATATRSVNVEGLRR